jgi:hypothetical protein
VGWSVDPLGCNRQPIPKYLEAIAGIPWVLRELETVLVRVATHLLKQHCVTPLTQSDAAKSKGIIHERGEQTHSADTLGSQGSVKCNYVAHPHILIRVHINARSGNLRRRFMQARQQVGQLPRQRFRGSGGSVRRALTSFGSDFPPARTGLKSEDAGTILADVKVRIRPHAWRSLEAIIWPLSQRVEALIADDKVSIDSFSFRRVAGLEKRRCD